MIVDIKLINSKTSPLIEVDGKIMSYDSPDSFSLVNKVRRTILLTTDDFHSVKHGKFLMYKDSFTLASSDLAHYLGWGTGLITDSDLTQIISLYNSGVTKIEVADYTPEPSFNIRSVNSHTKYILKNSKGFISLILKEC